VFDSIARARAKPPQQASCGKPARINRVATPATTARWLRRTRRSEPELLASARQGDLAAFEQPVASYRGELYAHRYRMLGSVHDAEDALQESLLGAWRGIAGFEGRSCARWPAAPRLTR
jgi:hypothetical protein